MHAINITVDAERRASAPIGAALIANNSDYQLTFSIDPASGFDLTAPINCIFVTARGALPPVPFAAGGFVTPPALTHNDGVLVYVGLTQGEIKTTTPAKLALLRSIYSTAGGHEAEPDPGPVNPPIVTDVTLDDLLLISDVEHGRQVLITLRTLSSVIGGGSTSDSLYPVVIGATSLDEIAEAVTEGKLPVVFSATLIYFYSEIENGVAHFIAPYGYNDYGDTGGGLNCLDYDGTDATTFEVELATTDDLNSYYIKPVAGIPKSDLASGVQSSLNKADTALQSVPNTYRTASQQDAIDDAQDAAIGSKYTKPTGGIPATDLTQSVQESLTKADAAVRYNSQTLTDPQKAQARENIGAASLDDIGTVFTIKGDVATVADLPATGNTVGDVWYVQSVSAGYVWLETTEHPSGYWEELGEPIDLSAYRTAADQDVIDAAKADKPFTVAFTQAANETWSMTTNYADWTAAKNAGRELWLSLTFANASTVLVKSYLGQMLFAGVTYAAFGTTLPAVTLGNLSTMRGNLIVFGFVDDAQMYNATIFKSVVMAKESDLAAKQDAATEVTNASSGAVSQACEDNTIYTFTGALTSLTLTEASGAREYIVIITTGSTAPTVTPPTGVVFPDGTNTFTAEANKRYEISVRDGFALVGSWAVSA